eukprot:jgi/Tetstr1/441476/TSEL_003119.t1
MGPTVRGRSALQPAAAVALGVLLIGAASGASVTCDGKPMEGSEGMAPYIVKMAPGASNADMEAATAWLTATYGADGGVSAISERPSTVIGPYFVAELSWEALQGLLSSEHGAAIEYAECDVAVSIAANATAADATAADVTVTRSAEEAALLESLLEEKLNCAELAEGQSRYIIKLADGSGLVAANLTEWVDASHPELADGLAVVGQSSMKDYVLAPLPPTVMEELLLHFRDSVEFVDCDVEAHCAAYGCPNNPPDCNADPDACAGPDSSAPRLAWAAAALPALLLAALLAA